MDYGKLSKKELLEEIEKRKLSFSSSWTKEQFEDLLIEDDQLKKQKITSKNNDEKKRKIDGIGFAGCIVNYVISGIMMSYGAILLPIMLLVGLVSPIAFLLLMIFVFFLFVLPILSILSSVKYQKGGDNKVAAGVFAIFTGGIVAGVLIFVSTKIE